MSNQLESFDFFVDDIISSQDNLLKGELDFLLMQYLFQTLDLDTLKDLKENVNSQDLSNSYLAA